MHNNNSEEEELYFQSNQKKIRNPQNDIIGLFDSDGNQVTSYSSYDSWGKIVSIKDGNGVGIIKDTASVGYKNPYRYRGYRYNTEVGLYYFLELL